MAEETDDFLNEKISALMEKQKKVKESESMDKLMAPSNSLRSLYNDVLSVKIRPKSAGRKRTSDPPDQASGGGGRVGLAPNRGKENGIFSPKRGKMRPTSAPNHRQKKVVLERQESPDSSDVDLPFANSMGKAQQGVPVDVGKYLNIDAWWEDFDVDTNEVGKKHNTLKSLRNSRSAPSMKRVTSLGKTKPGSTKDVSSSERARNYKPNFDADGGRQYLKEAKKKEKQQQDAIARRILEEANIMQAKCYTCVEEANSYAKYLGIRKRYTVFIKDTRDHAQSVKLKEQLHAGTNFDAFGTIDGAGDRIGKMAIEVIGEPGEPTSLISMEKFFREHEFLHDSLRKHRSLIPVSQQVAEAKCEEQDRNSSSSKSKRRGGMAKAIDGSGDEPRKYEIEKNAFLLPRSPTAFVDYSYDANNGHQPIHKLSRKETEEYLKKILDNTVNVTKVLEEQLTELQSRGWNHHII